MKRIVYALAAVPLPLLLLAGCSSGDKSGATPAAGPSWAAGPSAAGGVAAGEPGSPAPGMVSPSAAKPRPAPSGHQPSPAAKPVSTRSGGPGDVPTATSTAPRCHTSDLRVATGASRTTSGTTYLALVFTTKSGHKCQLAGYPDVSWADAAGKPVNSAFSQVNSETPAPPVTLSSGRSAHATLAFSSPSTVAAADCKPVAVTSYRVTPPYESAAITVKTSTTACSVAGVNLARVIAITAGSSL